MDPAWLRRITHWCPGQPPRSSEAAELAGGPGFPWIELACGPDDVGEVHDVLGPHCGALTPAMLEDLVTPDDEPEGLSYEDGAIRLASTFSVEALRGEQKVERGTPQGIGLLRFQPVELLAGPDWLIAVGIRNGPSAAPTRSGRKLLAQARSSSGASSTVGSTVTAAVPVISDSR